MGGGDERQVHSLLGLGLAVLYFLSGGSAPIKNSGRVSIGKRFLCGICAGEVLTGVCGYASSFLDE